MTIEISKPKSEHVSDYIQTMRIFNLIIFLHLT